MVACGFTQANVPLAMHGPCCSLHRKTAAMHLMGPGEVPEAARANSAASRRAYAQGALAAIDRGEGNAANCGDRGMRRDRKSRREPSR